MAQYLVIEDFAGGSFNMPAGSVIDGSSGSFNVPALQAAGMAAVVYDAATMAALVAAYRIVRANRGPQPGVLASLLQAGGAFPSLGPVVVGDTGTGGTKGLVPAPAAGDAAASKFLKADGSWAIAGGSIGVWLSDAPPLVPHAKDDEVTAGTLDAKWTEKDSGNRMVPSVENGHIRLRYTGGGDQKNAWLYQAVPASEFVFYAKLSIRYGSTPDNHQRLGICVLEDGADSSKRQDTIALVPSLTQIYGANWASYTGAETARGAAINYTASALYLRMRVSGTTCSADYSTDGVGWRPHWSATLAYTPAHFGLWMNNTSSLVCDALYKFVRVFVGAGCSVFDATSIGRTA